VIKKPKRHRFWLNLTKGGKKPWFKVLNIWNQQFFDFEI
jgi:hypothetical protein